MKGPLQCKCVGVYMHSDKFAIISSSGFAAWLLLYTDWLPKKSNSNNEFLLTRKSAQIS
jgi:hypothetical protein